MVAGPVVRRVFDLHDPAFDGDRFDYADCFEVTAAAPDVRAAESLARAALEGMPTAIRRVVLVAHRQVLRLRLGPLSSEEHVLGWRILTSSPDLVVLAAEGPLLRGVIVGRRTGAGVTLVRTFVVYRRPVAAVVWRVVGVLHRRVAPYLLKRAAATE